MTVLPRSSTSSFGFVLALAACATGCGGEPSPTASSSGGAASSSSASAQPAASTATPAASVPAATASAVAAEDPCKKRSLTLGGSGTREEPCKYDGELVRATSDGSIDDSGAPFAFANPWKEAVTAVDAAIYYYDAAGQQLAFKVGDTEKKSEVYKDVKVSVAGESSTTTKVGPAKKDLPAEVETAEVVVRAFAIDAGDGKAIWFATTAALRERRPIRGGEGPTGIPQCDQYRELLESCPKSFPDALKATRKSLKDYNWATPDTQKKLAEGLAKSCEQGIASSKERCAP